MQDFVANAGRLRRLPVNARIVYTVFLLFTLAGLALTAWLGADMFGPDLAHVQSYYAGGAEPQPDPAAGPPAALPGGPELDLPTDSPPPTAEAMPLRKLLEVSHFHLFSMPLYLMVLSHLFMLSRWRERTKRVWITLASLAILGHMLAPWWVRAQGAAGIAFYALSGAALAVSFGVMVAVPLWEMWWPGRRGM